MHESAVFWKIVAIVFAAGIFYQRLNDIEKDVAAISARVEMIAYSSLKQPDKPAGRGFGGQGSAPQAGARIDRLEVGFPYARFPLLHR